MAQLTPYDLIGQVMGKEVWDEEGTCYRVDDVRSRRDGSGYEYTIGLQPLGDLSQTPLVYVSLDRYDEMTY